MTWPEDLTREQPRSLCFPAAESLQKAVLKIASTKRSVTLLDDSAEDICVVLEGSPNFWIDDVGELQTTIGWFEVRVASIVRIEGEGENSAPKRVKFRVGLRRLREVASSVREPSRNKVVHLVRCVLVALFPLERNGIFSGIAVALLLITTPLVLAALAWNHTSPMAMKVSEWRENVFGRSVSTESTESVADSDLRNSANQLPGAEPFLLPKLADALSLTQEQRASLSRLNAATQQALRDFDQLWQNDSQSEHAKRRTMILDTARQEALRLLTDEQRDRWEKFAR